jgi:hydroxylamine reductase (hybrid-cluster protein)
LNGLEDIFGASFLIESDFKKAAAQMDQRISTKRLTLGLTDPAGDGIN